MQRLLPLERACIAPKGRWCPERSFAKVRRLAHWRARRDGKVYAAHRRNPAPKLLAPIGSTTFPPCKAYLPNPASFFFHVATLAPRTASHPAFTPTLPPP